MNDGIGSALAMQLVDPYLCASDIECILAFRIPGDHSMEQLFGFLSTTGPQTRLGRLESAGGGQGLGIDGGPHRLFRHKSIEALRDFGSRFDMSIGGLL